MSEKKTSGSNWDIAVMAILGVAASTIILWPSARLSQIQLPLLVLLLIHLRLEAKVLFGGGTKDPWAKPISEIHLGFRGQSPTWMLWTRGTVSLLAILASVLITLAD